MKRAVLRVVPPDEPPDLPAAPKRWQGEDDVFFHRSQIRLGSLLLCHGRIDHGTRWEVIAIRTLPTGKTRLRETSVVERLVDEVTLRRVGHFETRRARFAALSYSAIWRLERS